MIEFLASLDTYTLQVMTVIVMSLSLLLAATLWDSSAEQRHARYWVAGYFLVCLGLGLAGLRAHLPSFIAIVLGNVITAVGGVLVVNGTRAFCLPDRKPWPVAAIGASIFLLFCLFTYLYPNLRVRVVLMALLFACISLHMAWLLWTKAPVGMLWLQRGLAMLLSAQFCYYALSISTVLIPPNASDYPEAPAAYNAVYMNAAIVFIALLFGFSGLNSRRLQLRLQYAAHHDALTGALNRRALDDVVQHVFGNKSQDKLMSVVLLDLDYFKKFNDSFGHQAGDLALQRFAETIRAHLRQGDELGRIGGEEFCLVLPHTDMETARRIVERLRKVVAQIQIPGTDGAQLTFSAGIATTQREQHWEDLLKRADRALYQAKGDGRNRTVLARVT